MISNDIYATYSLRWLEQMEKSRINLLLESLEHHLHMSQTWLVAADSLNEKLWQSPGKIGVYDPLKIKAPRAYYQTAHLWITGLV